MGFADDEALRIYLHKLCSFYESLNEPERRVFRASLPDKFEALRSFRLDITASELEHYLRGRNDPFGAVILNVRGTNECDDDDSDQIEKT